MPLTSWFMCGTGGLIEVNLNAAIPPDLLRRRPFGEEVMQIQRFCGVFFSSLGRSVSQLVRPKIGLEIWSSVLRFLFATAIVGASATASAGPIIINSVVDLQNIQSDLSGNYVLGSDIDATGFKFTPIDGRISFGAFGTAALTPFTGVFNGLGHTITNLTITTGASNAGLFGEVGTGGVVENVGLIGGSVTTTASANVGALVGNNSGTILNAFATGTVTTAGFLSTAGGLVGLNNIGGTITNSHATGAVTNGNINANASTGYGGLVGQNNGGTITKSFATGAVSAPRGNNVGGLVGVNQANGTISNSYAMGAASLSNVPGFIPEGNAGGLAGILGVGSISNVYATGAVSGGSKNGGLSGVNLGATITNGYWDTQTSGQSTSAGGGTGLTTAQLKSGTLPSGFDPSIWTATPGQYPTLISTPASSPPSQLELAQMSQGAELFRAGIFKDAPVNKFSVVQEGIGKGGFSYQIWQNGDQVVLAIGGTLVAATIDAVKTVLADSSFTCSTPLTCHVVSNDMKAEVSQAATLLASMATDPRFAGNNITLTGHSLGGAVVQILGSKTALPTQAFDAPGAGDLLAQLTAALSPLNGVSFANSSSSNMNANLRMYGDQVSVVSSALIGPQTTIASNTPQTDEHVWASAFANHDVGNMVLQLQANAPQSDGITGPVASIRIGAVEVLASIVKLAFSVVVAVDYVIDPASAFKYLFTEDPGSPYLSSVTLPSLPGTNVVAYDIEQFSSGVWSSPIQIDPLQTFLFDPLTTGFEFWGLDGANSDIPLPTGFLFEVSFASTGEFSGTLESIDPVISPVSEPPIWSLFLFIVIALYFSASYRQKRLNVLATQARRSRIR